MADSEPRADISPMSQEFTDDGITADVLIYWIDGNAGWTLEIAIDDETSIVWAELFSTDGDAWAEFAKVIEGDGLRSLIEEDEGDTATVH
jgi:hypothetical protein